MGNLIDLSGKRFGRLSVLNIAYSTPAKVYYWNCLCDCGNYCTIMGNSLRKPNGTRSCGCIHKEATSLAKKKHGLSKKTTPEYRAWKAMKKRCYNPNYHSFHNYGGRGIIVSESWINSFQNFYNDMGERPSPNHSLDRIDVNGNYCKWNCKWSTQTEQSKNRNCNRWYSYNGKKMILSDWAKFFGSHFSNVSRMLKNKNFEQVYKHYIK